MKAILAVLLLLVGLAFAVGCETKSERNARRIEQRNRVIRRNLEGIPDDIEAILLTDEPLRLGEYEGY